MQRFRYKPRLFCRITAGLPLLCLALPLSASAQELGADRPQIQGPLTVRQAVQTGLQNNSLIRASQAEAKATAAETRAVRSQTQPQMSANTYLSYGDSPNILSTTPGVM